MNTRDLILGKILNYKSNEPFASVMVFYDNPYYDMSKYDDELDKTEKPITTKDITQEELENILFVVGAKEKLLNSDKWLENRRRKCKVSCKQIFMPTYGMRDGKRILKADDETISLIESAANGNNIQDIYIT